ncbi:MAG: T9SS type A sorting domain-containing protein, partial [Bacteroidota bacterium]
YSIIIIAASLGLSAQTDQIQHFTYVDCQQTGNVAVRILEPQEARYPEGAPIVVGISAFFTPNTSFHNNDATDCGAILVSYLWPGISAGESRSEGEYDHAGDNCMAALREVIEFACGNKADIYGKKLGDYTELTPLFNNIGIYTFSHQGIAGTKFLGLYGAEFPEVKYFIGRENPTVPATSSMEIGHWDDDGRPVRNTFYKYPMDYSPDSLLMNYDTIEWIVDDDNPNGKPAFIAPGKEPYILGDKVPRMWNLRFYSPELTAKLRENSFPGGVGWPVDVASPELTASTWPERNSVNYYGMITNDRPDLKVMLVFADKDHVQIALDKPHIHQAFDGFRDGGMWVRLNPDAEYIASADPNMPDPVDNPANSDPDDWMNITEWSYRDGPGASVHVPLAAMAEMMDRTQYDDWDIDLEEIYEDVRIDLPPPIPANIVHIPSEAGGEEGICVQIITPETPRYGSRGAPIAVYAIGGWNGRDVPVSISPGMITDFGFIEIHFNMPGSGQDIYKSGGVYDLRGENCARALRDVLRFAMGMTADTEGKYLGDLTGGIVPLYSNTGMLGLSNGGNLTITTTAFHNDLQFLQWIVNWESPVGEGIPTALAGSRGGPDADPPNPLNNPAYNPDDNTYDWELLKYSPDAYFSFNGIQINGGLYFDVNENDHVDYGIDFIPTALVYRNEVFYATPLAREAIERGLYPDPRPAHFPDYYTTDAFWRERNGAHLMDQAGANYPDLLFIIEGSDQDHVQTAPNHPHIVAQNQGFIDAGIRFVRLNPDNVYINYVAGREVEEAVDNPAFMEVDYDNIKSALEPHQAVNLRMGVYASACELADRYFYSNYDIDLEAVITGPGDVYEFDKNDIIASPNPFSENVKFEIENDLSECIINIYNATGVRVLSDKFMNKYIWDGHDYAGRMLPAGMYYYIIQMNGKYIAGKLIRLAD